LSTVSVERPDVWIGAHDPIKKRDAFSIVRLFVKLQIDHILHKLLEGKRTEATERLWRSCHLLFAHKKPFVFSLNTKIIK
jgi:hypothetical protein